MLFFSRPRHSSRVNGLRPQGGRRRKLARPWLELLEDRTVPAYNFRTPIFEMGTALHETGNNWAFVMPERADWNNDDRPDLFAIKTSQTGTASTEVHILDGANNFQSFLLQTGTVLPETGDNWTFDVGHYNDDDKLDLVAIKKNQTGSGFTEIAVLNGANGFQSYLLPLTATALHATDSTWDFALMKREVLVIDFLGPFGSSHWEERITGLAGIKKSGTGSGTTEVHALSKASNFQSFSTQTGTALHPTGDNWAFDIADWNRDHIPDLIGFAKSQTGSGTTEVHILNGADNFQSFLLQTRSALHPTDNTFALAMSEWNRDGTKEFVAIKKSQTGTNSTEVHIYDGRATGIFWDNRGDDGFAIYENPNLPGSEAVAARAVVDAVISAWESVIVNFNQADGGNAIHLNISARDLAPQNPNWLGVTSGIQADGNKKPLSATIQMDDNAAGLGWWFDSTPGDNSEFTSLINRFAASSTSFTGHDFYDTLVHEVGHAMGIASNTDLAINGLLTDPMLPGEPPDNGIRSLGTFATLIRDGGLHVYGGLPVGGGLPTHRNDLMNPSTATQRRHLISTLDVQILQTAYGYGVSLPSLFQSFLVSLDANGTLTINGNPAVGNDGFRISRLGSLIQLIVNGEMVTVPFGSVNAINIRAGTGADTVTVDFAGGNPIPMGGLSYDGGTDPDIPNPVVDTLITQGGTFATVIYSGTTTTSGTVTIGGRVITYTGLDPIIDVTTAMDRVFVDATGAGQRILLTDDGDPNNGLSLINSDGTGAFESITFANPTHSLTVHGGDGQDTVIVRDLDPAFTAGLTLDGGGEADTVISLGPSWDITGPNAGAVSRAAFVSFENLTGGGGPDRFLFFSGGSISGNIDGGGGRNTLEYTHVAGPVSVNLQTYQATSIGGTFANISTFVGSTGSDTVIGPNSPTAWVVNGVNTVSVAGSSFTDFENLMGGSADDQFSIRTGARLDGQINGGGGVNSLSYADYVGDVFVNLALNLATAVGQGVFNIQNVIGGTGDSMLVGDALNNVLRGGTGRSVTIGGAGADSVFGSGGDNILIGDRTAHDRDLTALSAIMAEWTRTDLGFEQRVAHLISNGQNDDRRNGSYLLSKNTVLSDGASDSLTGGVGLDWFFVTLMEDILSNRKPEDHITVL
jgi:hypothetical protein